MLYLPPEIYELVRREAEAAYPAECCGILLGALDGAVDGVARRVTQAVPAANASRTPRNHYEIAPLDLIHAERAARQSGVEILGFYHSHPDHPAQPSATDLAEAHWLGASYVITSVERGVAEETCSFLLIGSSEETKIFQAEEILSGS
jgi:proteasome lid subunit RPN8/RPN11